ncbi:MAG: trehalose-phosphatase [Chloroflexi bacterium]|nr:trehalose-phosphatase [Chloroflexota bacterium]
MQHLFQSWQYFSSDIRAAAHILLLADYDGTLTKTVSRPEDAILPENVRKMLRALAGKEGFSVGIISGRSLAEVKRLVDVAGIYYSGNHGLEIEDSGFHFLHPVASIARAEIKDLDRKLSLMLSSIEGVIIENKGLSLSVHYRLVKESEEKAVAEIFHRVVSPRVIAGKVRIGSGKKVWEVRPPVDWDKGKAVVTIQQKIKTLLGIEEMITIYLGDDNTDEDAFRVTHRPQGWSIFVGDKKASSNADYWLSSVPEVETFLSRLLELK